MDFARLNLGPYGINIMNTNTPLSMKLLTDPSIGTLETMNLELVNKITVIQTIYILIID